MNQFENAEEAEKADFAKVTSQIEDKTLIISWLRNLLFQEETELNRLFSQRRKACPHPSRSEHASDYYGPEGEWSDPEIIYHLCCDVCLLVLEPCCQGCGLQIDSCGHGMRKTCPDCLDSKKQKQETRLEKT